MGTSCLGLFKQDSLLAMSLEPRGMSIETWTNIVITHKLGSQALSKWCQCFLCFVDVLFANICAGLGVLSRRITYFEGDIEEVWWGGHYPSVRLPSPTSKAIEGRTKYLIPPHNLQGNFLMGLCVGDWNGNGAPSPLPTTSLRSCLRLPLHFANATWVASNEQRVEAVIVNIALVLIAIADAGHACDMKI